MFDLKEIVIMCREKGREKFKEKAKYTNIDEGKCMITFISYTENVRKINDWGREEDKDVHIGLDENGWICYYQTNQNGAGDFEIIDENTTAVSDDYIVNYRDISEAAPAGSWSKKRAYVLSEAFANLQNQ